MTIRRLKSKLRDYLPTIFWVVMVVLLLLSVWWPTDTKWVWDEPKLIHNAYQANQQGVLAPHGLIGSRGVHYSPVATWIYQVLLLAAPNLTMLALLKTLLSISSLVLFLWLLSRELRWSPWPILLVLVSPYLYLYNRQLWDNVFLIPLSACLWWLLASFARRPGYGKLLSGLTVAVVMVYIHVVSLPLVAGWSVGMVLAGWSWWKAHIVHSLLSTACGVGLMVAYLLHLQSGASEDTLFLSSSRLIAGWHSLAAWQFFSLENLNMVFLGAMYTPSFVLPSWVLNLLRVIGLLSLPLVLVGMGQAIRQLCQVRTSRVSKWGMEVHLSLAALAAILAFAGLFTVTQQMVMHHYFNGIWVAHFWFLWLGIHVLWSWHRSCRGIILLHGVALAIATGAIACHIHQRAGTRDAAFGPTLTTQLGVVTKLAPYRLANIQTEVRNYQQVPFAFANLLDLVDDDHPPIAERPPAFIVIRYRENDPVDAHLAVDIEPKIDSEPSATPPLAPE